MASTINLLNDDYPCTTCSLNVGNDSICCDICDRWTHRLCAKISSKKLLRLSKEKYYFYCEDCEQAFPFRDVKTLDLITTECGYSFVNDLKLLQLQFDATNSTECLPTDYLSDVVNSNCLYYDAKSFNSQLGKTSGFSIIHFNARCLRKNFDYIVEYCSSLKTKFDVIAVSETWFDGVSDYLCSIPGYECYKTNRIGRKGGGVAIF